MTSPVLTIRMRSAQSFAPHGGLKTPSRYRPIAIDRKSSPFEPLFHCEYSRALAFGRSRSRGPLRLTEIIKKGTKSVNADKH